jgi:hypothetical protein
MRMVPYMPLLSSTMMLLAPCCTAVASSWPFIRKSPSPAMVKATLPWPCARMVMAAAMPAGTP